jgi:putative membrane protein
MTKKLILAISLAAAMALTASAALAQAPDKDSQKFIEAAIEGNLAEIDNGKLAQEKGVSEDVKSFGTMLVKDHTEANEKANEVASQLGVTPPTGSSLAQKADYLKLKVLSGAPFDREFARHMVKDHQDDIKEFQKESQKGDSIGDFAKQSLPTLRKHLQQAERLQQQTIGSR